ncbi:MAG: 2-oxoglutarate dehydrogenase complex dihydrolipoyllysine-residue succinyltransferase [Bacteroidetes bacterium]|nr:MAG: 2-oxoglutarate dehydrogenase complex dihydrolipoyllysine-residue succinyltransferase [Bacteroidota bacterium]
MIDIRVPEAGESITQVELAKWLVADGEYVEKDQEIAEIDSDKATLTINADDDGVIKIIIEEGTTIEPGKVIGQIDNSVKKEKKEKPTEDKKAEKEEKSEKTAQETQTEKEKESDEEKKKKPEPTEAAAVGFTLSPQAKRLLDELEVSAEEVVQNPDNKRITRKDILQAIAERVGGDKEVSANTAAFATIWQGSRDSKKIKMTTLRRKVAERLVAVKNETAMLTTFNEVDMSAIISIRNQYKDKFEKKHGIKPGFMSFFVKAVTSAIPLFPQVNGQIDDGHIVLPDYADIGIAVSTPKGLMVPVIRDAQKKSFAEIETVIAELAKKARDNKITIEELTGGTFSITNGGIFGSMLSTPIINPPQSAILGMHNIVERPVAVNGRVEIRPVMYVALSYDHRIIDGKESVSFLVAVKQFLENPAAMLSPGKKPEELLLGL